MSGLPTPEELAWRVRQVCPDDRSGLSLDSFASTAGVSQPTLSRVRKGQPDGPCKPGIIQKVVAALDEHGVPHSPPNSESTSTASPPTKSAASARDHAPDFETGLEPLLGPRQAAWVEAQIERSRHLGSVPVTDAEVELARLMTRILRLDG